MDGSCLVKKLEKELAFMRKKMQVMRMKLDTRKMCKNCVEFRRERDFHFRKCKIHERRIAELDEKLVEHVKLLAESRDEVSELKAQLPRVALHDNLKNESDSPTVNGVDAMGLVVPKLEVEDPHRDEDPNDDRNEVEDFTDLHDEMDARVTDTLEGDTQVTVDLCTANNGGAAKPRRSFTNEFKLGVVRYAKERGNRAAGREFNVNERCVRDWIKNEDELRKLPCKMRARRYGKVRVSKVRKVTPSTYCA